MARTVNVLSVVIVRKSRTKSYIVVTHFQVDGAPQELARYIETLDDCGSLTIISHPLEPREGSVHTCSRKLASNLGGAGSVQLTARCLGTGIIEYIWSIILTLYWIMSSRADVAFGANCLNMISLIILKKLGRINRLIYYTIDYIPIRFNNRALNFIYHLVEKSAVLNADVVWNLSSAMADAREARGYSIILKEKQVTVPIGVYFEPDKFSGSHDFANRLFVYVGMLARKQGVFEIVEALARVTRYFPDTRLRFIGDGVDRLDLQRRVAQLGLDGVVEFEGMVTDRRKVVELLREGSVGLAPYRTNPGNFSHFADPTKFKDYLMAGLPIIFTKVSKFAEELIITNAGIVVKETPESIANAMILYMMFPDYRIKNALNGRKLAVKLQWANIFDAAFRDLRLRIQNN